MSESEVRTEEEEWPEDLTVCATDIYRLRGGQSTWRILSADFEENEICVVCIESGLNWRRTSQQFLKDFQREMTSKIDTNNFV